MFFHAKVGLSARERTGIPGTHIAIVASNYFLLTDTCVVLSAREKHQKTHSIVGVHSAHGNKQEGCSKSVHLQYST